MEPLSSNSPPGVAVVIGSGGVKCAAALGLWRVLQQEGIPVSMAVGCSAGSIYAAVIALGYELETAERMTLEFWTGGLVQGYASNLRAALLGETRFTERTGLADDGPMLAKLTAAFGARTFAETVLPLHVVSTDFHTGEAVVHTSGRIVDVLRASVAIPQIFPSWQIGEQLLVDGAVSNPLPIDVAIKEGAEIILAMGFELPTRAHIRSYTAMTAHLNSLYMNNILKASFSFYNLAHHAEVIPILPELERSVGTFDFQQIPVIMEAGAQATREQLPYLTRLLAART